MVSGKTPGCLNKDLTPKYRITIRNFIDDTESSMDFPTFASISRYLETKGIQMSTANIQRYVCCSRQSPLLLSFSKIPEHQN